MCQHLTRKTQTWLRVPNRGYTCHILFMRGYTWLNTACVSKGPRGTYRQSAISRKAIHPSYIWLYDPGRGYTSEFVVIRLVLLVIRLQPTRKTQSVVRCPWPRLFVSCRNYAWLYGLYIVHVPMSPPHHTWRQSRSALCCHIHNLKLFSFLFYNILVEARSEGRVGMLATGVSKSVM